MHITKKSLASVLLIWSAIASAATYTDGFVTVEIPLGFDRSAEQSLGLGANSKAYVKPYPGQEGGTLLQITTYDFGSKLDAMPKDQRGPASEFYLAQFLGGIGKKRSSFSRFPPTQVDLGGVPAAWASWSGALDGVAMTGVMYCMVVRPRVICFHTQDRDDAPPANRSEAIHSIETARFKSGG